MPGRVGRAAGAANGAVSLHRFYCPDAVREEEQVRIDGAAARQIRQVLRLGPGDRVILFGRDAWEYTVRLESVERTAANGTIVSQSMANAEPRCALTLAVALLKGEKTEWVLQKGTELGVGRFVLMQTQRTVVTPDERRAVGRRERYERIVVEATEQCGRLRPPQVLGVRLFREALAEADGRGAFILHERASERLSALVPGCMADRRSAVQPFPCPGGEADPCPEPIPQAVLFVGPEGGFTEEEVALATARHTRAASLGPRVLRAETAALAAVTLLMDALEREMAPGD